MANPWFALYAGDFDAKTAHLSMVEDGAYNRLLRHYYRTGKPLPAIADVLLRVCRAFAEDEKAATLKVLSEFFVLEEDGWHNKRADEELSKSSQLSEKRRIAGKKGAEKTNLKYPAIAAALADEAERQLPTQPQPQLHISTTPIPPEVGGAKLKRKKFNFEGYKAGVTEVVNYLNEKWPEVRPGDKSPIRFNNAAFADRVDALIQQGFSVEQLKSIGDKYLAEPNDWPSCPHFFFGPGKPNGSGANNYLAYAKMLIHEQSKVVTH